MTLAFTPAGRGGQLAVLGWLVLTACSVPQLKELGDKRCDLDAGHGCITGYACQSGLCKIPSGMPCTEGQTRACGTDVGECVRGTQSCTEGVFGDCVGAVGPATELCDGKDNDCDDQIDEELTTAPACEKQEGVCAGKNKACVAGSYVTTCGATEYGTDYQPDETRCDGKDNDCDGMTDEGITSTTPCALTAGVCANTFAACSAGTIESTCTAVSYGPDYQPAESRCDGLDNDCDGVTDRLPDAGYVRVGSCELTSGVCAGAGRACLAGNGEAPCTAASYGPTYEVNELSCDSLDNDCDGRVDVSKEATLLATPNAASNHVSLASSTLGGSAAVYVDQRRGASRVFFRRFDDALRTFGNEFELSDPTATDAIRPSLVRLGADYAVVWLETVSGSTRIMLARVADTGTVGWSRTVASAVSVFKDPRVAASPVGSSDVAVVWIGSDLSLRGSVFSGAGTLTVPVRTLVAAPELVFGVDVARRQTTSDFVIGWSAQLTGTFRARFQAFNAGLDAIATPREEAVAGETTDSLRVAVSGASGEVLGAWLGSSTQADAGTLSTLRWLPNAISSPQNLAVSTYAGVSTDLSLATTATGAAAFWAQGGSLARLVGTSLGSDAGVRDFTPAGVTGLFAPGVTSLDGGVLQVGYEADRGMGLDLFGQVICRP